jgi:hypothetical protein
MQQAMDLVVTVGGFATLVIVVCVAVMLLISFVERDRRSDAPPRDEDRKS